MINTVSQYREKDFLLALLGEYQKEYGSEIRHFNTHVFSSINAANPICERLPEFKVTKDEACTAVLGPWFDEAKARGHVIDKSGNGLIYCFTESGYGKALRYKHRFSFFFKDHWKFLVPVILTFISVTIAIIKLNS